MIDERERKLLNLAKDLPIGGDFLEEFPDQDELLRVGLTVSIRRLMVIICNTESAAKDIIPAARLIFQLNGKDVGDGGEDGLSKADAQKISNELVGALARSKKAE